MDKFGLIGHPIAHSSSPALFTAAYGGKYRYDLIETPDFDVAWARFLADYKAINITAPFKGDAYARVDWRSPESERVGATNLVVKTPEGTKAYNSDYRGVKSLLEPLGCRTAAVIGFGGAGKAALAAAEDLGLDTRLYRHAEVAGGVSADIISFRAPSKASTASTAPICWKRITKIPASRAVRATSPAPPGSWRRPSPATP